MSVDTEQLAILGLLASYMAKSLFSVTMLTYYAIGGAMLIASALITGWHKVITWRAVKGIAATFAVLAMNVLVLPILFLATNWLQAAYDSLQIPAVSPATWAECPFWLAVLCAIVGRDFTDYWVHRILHRQTLWPIHAIHHSDHDVNPFTAFRVHAFESVLMQAGYLILLSWLGFSGEVVATTAFIHTIHNMYVHLNVDWDHGPLKLLIASPRFHRWHHADVPAAYGKNLAGSIPLFDYVFGTYYVPGGCTDEAMGAKGIKHADPIEMAAYPLVEWLRMAKSSQQRVENVHFSWTPHA